MREFEHFKNLKLDNRTKLMSKYIFENFIKKVNFSFETCRLGIASFISKKLYYELWY